MIELKTTVKKGALIVPPFDFSSLEGLDLVLTIKRFRSQRSNDQNKLYWGGVLRQISDATGNDVNAIHDYCRSQFLPPSFIVFNGKQLKTLGHTPECDTKEFSEYIEKIIAHFAIEFGIIINI